VAPPDIKEGLHREKTKEKRGTEAKSERTLGKGQAFSVGREGANLSRGPRGKIGGEAYDWRNGLKKKKGGSDRHRILQNNSAKRERNFIAVLQRA